MLLERLKTAGILIIFFLLVILFSPAWFLYIVASIMILLSSWEFFEITLPKQPQGERIYCLALATLFPAAAYSGEAVFLYGSLFLSFFLLTFRCALFGPENLKHRLDTFKNCLFGIIYISFCFSHFLLLRNLEAWKPWIITILLVTYAGDATAYFAGNKFGKRKLSPLLSPNKTIEGAIGGLLASILALYICKFFSSSLSNISNMQAFLVAVILAVSGQAGDLVESLIKRSYGVKDSGKILPGHGGILDRIDSILLAGPIGYYLAFFL